MDSKGRIAIPVRFREQISPEDAADLRLVQSYIKPEHLKLFPKTAWNRLINNIETKGTASEKAAFRSLVVGGAHPVTFDVQGRILVPPILRDAAKLAGDVLIVGAIDQIQIWSPALRQESVDSLQAIFQQSKEFLNNAGW